MSNLVPNKNHLNQNEVIHRLNQRFSSENNYNIRECFGLILITCNLPLFCSIKPIMTFASINVNKDQIEVRMSASLQLGKIENCQTLVLRMVDEALNL